MARATSSLPTPLSPRISTVALVPATRPIWFSIAFIDSMAADQLALDLELIAQRPVFGGQGRLPLQLMRHRAELLGHRDGELQVFGVQRLVRVGAIKVDQAQDFFAEHDGSADQAGGAHALEAFAIAQVAIAGHILGQHRPRGWRSTSLVTNSETRV